MKFLDAKFKQVIFITIFIAALSFVQIQGLPERDASAEATRHFEDTIRVDPLDNLKEYRGGYNLTSKHYWSSTAYTGIPGFVLGGLLLLCGIGYGGYLLATITCCKGSRKLEKRSPWACRYQCYLWHILVAIILTLLAIMACGLVLGANAKFHSRAETIVDILINTADEIPITMYKTTAAMKEMNTSLIAVGGNTEFLTRTSQSLDVQAADIQRLVSDNRQAIEKGLKILYAITTGTISLALISIIALLVVGVLKLRKPLQILLAVCWIFTIICCIYFGSYIFIQNFAGDTCAALEDFEQNPYNNSLSSLLPCRELLPAKSGLLNITQGVYNLVNEVNQNISTTIGNVLQICNPFSGPPSYEYVPCPVDSVKVGDIPKILRGFVCPDRDYTEDPSTCVGGILVEATLFDTVTAYTTLIQTFSNVYPDMDSLVECRTVKDAFSDILKNQCKPLKKNVGMVWRSLVFLVVVIVAKILVWITGIYHQENLHSLNNSSSIRPTSYEVDALEAGTVKYTVDDELKPI